MAENYSFRNYCRQGLAIIAFLCLFTSFADAQIFRAGSSYLAIDAGRKTYWYLDLAVLADSLVQEMLLLPSDSLDPAFTTGPRKLNPALVAPDGASSGDVLTYNGTAVVWSAGGGGADTTKLVSMDRDDNVSGEKAFLGSATVRRQFGIGNISPSTFSGSLDDEGLQIVPDTASRRATPYTVMVNSAGFGTLWGVHETGIVDFARQSAFRGYRSTNQSITTAASQMSCNAESFDQQDEHATSGGNPYKFTATEAGKYHVLARATVVTQTANTAYLMIYRNGGQVALGGTVTAIYQGFLGYAAYVAVEDIITLAAGQYLEIYVQSNVSGYMYGSADETFFLVHKVL